MEPTEKDIAEPISPTQDIPGERSAPASVEAPSRQKASIGALLGNIFSVFAVAAFAAVVVVWAKGQFFDGETMQQVAIVDVTGLVKEELDMLGKKARNGEISLEDMPKRSKLFSEALVGRLNAYAEQGVVVLKADAVLSRPDYVLDLTKKIRAELQASGVMETIVYSKE